MNIFTFDDVASLKISPKECYEWAVDAISHKSKAILPPKISMKPRPGVFCNVMPSIIPAEFSPLGHSVGGVKIVTRYPERVPSLSSKILVFNADSGEELALIDANWITAIRTGAVAAHTIRLFAKSDYRTIGIIGLGNTARASLLVLAETESRRSFRVRLLRHKQQEESFMQRFADYGNISFECVDSLEELVQGSDVVLSAVTYAERDFCSDECFSEGVLVVPVHTLGFTNCDVFFDKVFADDTGHVKHFKHFSEFRSFAEVSDVVNGKAPGREGNRDRILAYNIGISLHDVNFTAHVLKRFADSGKTSASIDMHDPSAKFWL